MTIVHGRSKQKLSLVWPLINTEGLSCALSTLMKIIIIIFLIGSIRTFLIYLFLYWPCHAASGILVPWLGIESMPPAVEVWSPNHWTARELPIVEFLFYVRAILSLRRKSLYNKYFVTYTQEYSARWRNVFRCLSDLLFSHLVAKSCPTLLWPHGCSPPGSSILGISQARILEWVAVSFSRGSSWPRDQTLIGRQVLYHWVTWEAQKTAVQLAKGENLFSASSGFWWPLHSLACACITSISASIFTSPSSLGVQPPSDCLLGAHCKISSQYF